MPLPRYSPFAVLAYALPLYAGPLLAGWARHPWASAAALVALFLFVMAVTRRHMLTGWAALAGLFAVQVLLVGAIYGLGVGLGVVTGAPALPVWLPLALTGAASVWGAWIYRRAPEMDGLLDNALSALDGMASRDCPGGCVDYSALEGLAPAQRAAVETALADLRALPGDKVNAGFIDPIVQELEGRAGVSAFEALLEETEMGDARIDFAFMRYVASPAIRRRLIETGEFGDVSRIAVSCDTAPAARAEGIGLIYTAMDEGVHPLDLPEPDDLREMGEAALADAIAEHTAKLDAGGERD